VLLCMKPQAFREVLEEIRPHVGEKALVISVAASVPTSYIEQHRSGVPVVRGCLFQAGGGLRNGGDCRGAHATAEHLRSPAPCSTRWAARYWSREAHGRGYRTSASGRRLRHHFESLAGRESKSVAARNGHVAGRATMKGSARWCWDGNHPALPKDGNDPGGRTIDGILELKKGSCVRSSRQSSLHPVPETCSSRNDASGMV
jgi:hypothetical protein